VVAGGEDHFMARMNSMTTHCTTAPQS
jgi:hypothetical protein